MKSIKQKLLSTAMAAIVGFYTSAALADQTINNIKGFTFNAPITHVQDILYYSNAAGVGYVALYFDQYASTVNVVNSAGNLVSWTPGANRLIEIVMPAAALPPACLDTVRQQKQTNDIVKRLNPSDTTSSPISFNIQDAAGTAFKYSAGATGVTVSLTSVTRISCDSGANW